MIWLDEYSLLYVLPQKFGPEAEILDPCMVMLVSLYGTITLYKF